MWSSCVKVACVVGCDGQLNDKSLIEFAGAFSTALLSADVTVDEAFKKGRAAVKSRPKSENLPLEQGCSMFGL